MLSYILILHQTTTILFSSISFISCLISLFYIKPQLLGYRHVGKPSCLISLFYIKPQPTSCVFGQQDGCLISLFYIKPQLSDDDKLSVLVVLYLYSTSNHNMPIYTFSMSELSYIFILHQTTTVSLIFYLYLWLSYIFILHQTTTTRERGK